jgi:hypothetical protein
VLGFILFAVSMALTQRRGQTWGLIAPAVAFLAGLLVAFVLVQPWDGKSLRGLPQGTDDFGPAETRRRGVIL